MNTENGLIDKKIDDYAQVSPAKKNDTLRQYVSEQTITKMHQLYIKNNKVSVITSTNNNIRKIITDRNQQKLESRHAKAENVMDI